MCRHYVEHSTAYLDRETIGTEAGRSYVRFDPLGPILATMPWNFPLWQVFRAGNVGLLEHAASTTGCGLAVEEILTEAGLPEGGFTTLLVGHETAAEVIGDRRVRGVTLTGSDRAGRAVAETAGRRLEKTVLELGCCDPCIVLDDADFDEAARTAVRSRYLDSGQSCINAKRMIVLQEVYEDFVERFRAEVETLVVGDPTDPGTDLGPLARADLRDTVHDQVFGPVAALMDVESEETAIAPANSSRYGLGAAVWTADLERGERIAGRIESRMVFVNELVKSDPRLPFGGVKGSGYGRELARQGSSRLRTPRPSGYAQSRPHRVACNCDDHIRAVGGHPGQHAHTEDTDVGLEAIGLTGQGAVLCL